MHLGILPVEASAHRKSLWEKRKIAPATHVYLFGDSSYDDSVPLRRGSGSAVPEGSVPCQQPPSDEVNPLPDRRLLVVPSVPLTALPDYHVVPQVVGIFQEAAEQVAPRHTGRQSGGD